MKYKFLTTINSPRDLKKMKISQLDMLCSEIRECILDTVSQTGGHLASNLGAVELTVALHSVFSCPKDDIVWDVGHQSYTHKLLTGRQEGFSKLRKEGGLSGFTRPSESTYDSFIAGHAGNSLSAAYGIAVSKRLQGKQGHTISVTGDGALGNGMIFEAMNNAGRSKEKLILIINDNEMSISSNVGAVAKYLANIRSHNSYFRAKDAIEHGVESIPLVGDFAKTAISKSKTMIKDYLYQSNFFESFGFTYLGPVDGHDISSLRQVLLRARSLNKPVVIHVNTKKGLGYHHAQKNPENYHGVSPFNKELGVSGSGNNFSSEFGKTLTKLAKDDKKIIAITAAMTSGTGLEEFAQTYSEDGRFFDTGIAEEHAVTFAAAMASKGMKPVITLYSTFWQRGYDQIIHDVAIEKEPLILAVDRAGVVGEDGETHQGIFDVSMMRSIPNMTIYSPSSYETLEKAFTEALANLGGPIAIRYPRGKEPILDNKYKSNSTDYNYIDNKSDTIVITYGRLWEQVCNACHMTKDSISIMNITKIHPINTKIIEIIKEYKYIYFYEEGIASGGIGEGIALQLLLAGYKGNYNLKAINGFVPQADVSTTLAKLGLDVLSIYNDVKERYEQNNEN